MAIIPLVQMDDTTGLLKETFVNTAGDGSVDATSLQAVPISVVVPAEGDVLTVVSGEWVGTPPTGNATSIQGVPVAATAPTLGQVPTYNGTQYAPATPAGGGGSGSGSGVNNLAVNGAFDLPDQASWEVHLTAAALTQIAPMWWFETNSTDDTWDAFIVRFDHTVAHNGLPPSIYNHLEVYAGADQTITYLHYRLENWGFNARAVAISFFAKSNEGGTFTLQLLNQNGVNAATTSPTFTPTSAWTRITKILTMTTTNADNTYDGLEMRIRFPILGVMSGLFITGVQVQVSDVIVGTSGGDITAAGPYTRPRMGDESSAINRWTVYTDPAQFYRWLFTAASLINAFTFRSVDTGAVTQWSPSVFLPVEMVKTPTVKFASVNDTASAQVYNETRGEHCTLTTAVRVGRRGFIIEFVGSAGTLPGDILSVHWWASCERLL